MNDSFPTTADEFYHLRDNRTNQYTNATGYWNAKVCVTADRGCLETYSGQVLLIASCNLLSRWCRKVFLYVEDTQPHPAIKLGTGSLLEGILSQMRDADPFGHFEVMGGKPTSEDLLLHIGTECRQGNASTTALSASDWTAAANPPETVGVKFNDSLNCVGALFAAGIGSARVFRDAVGMPGFLPIPLQFDGFSLLPITGPKGSRDLSYPSDLNIGSLLMVGAGSVGSAAAYCMRYLGLQCALGIVDGDVVDVVNFNRSPTMGKSQFGLNKARALAAFLSESGIDPLAYDVWWNEFAGPPSKAIDNFDLWLPLANEFGVRSNMTHVIPPPMIHASTNQNWGVNFGRHIPGRDDCLLERFAGLSSEASFHCASGKVEDPVGKKVDAALPFLSFIAGLLVAVDLVRLKLPDYPQVGNYANFDFGGDYVRPMIANRTASSACICVSPVQRLIFERRRAKGRYAHLAWQ